MRTADNSPFEGIIRGVSPSGKLEVEVLGEIEVFDLKELRFR